MLVTMPSLNTLQDMTKGLKKQEGERVAVLNGDAMNSTINTLNDVSMIYDMVYDGMEDAYN